MEIAIIAGIAIVAIVAMTGLGQGGSSSGPAPAVPDVGNLSDAGSVGAQVNALVAQPSSAPGGVGNAPISAAGQTPIFSRTTSFVSRPPVRTPINVAAAPRMPRTPSVSVPRPAPQRVTFGTA